MEPQLLKKYPVLDEARFAYIRLRSKGKSRDDSLQEMFDMQSRICLPYDQQMLERIAIGDAMAEYHELTEPMAITVEDSVHEFLRLHPRMENTLHRARDQILQPENFGSAAVYPAWTEYRPPWESGDVFCYSLRGYFPELFHLEGKTLLIYAAGDRISDSGFYEELVYLSICEDNTLPQNMDELNALGFLPGFTIFKEYQYLHALLIRREKELTALKLQKLGNFSGSPILRRERPDPDRNALPIVPAYAGKNKITLMRAVCASYQHFGLIANAEQAQMAKKEWNYGYESRVKLGEALNSVVMEQIPIGQLTSRTYFYHIGKTRERIPNKNTMILED